MKTAVLLTLAVAAGCLVSADSLMANTGCQSDYVDFTAAGSFSDGSTLSGNLDIDVGCDFVHSGDLSVVGNHINVTFAGTPYYEGAPEPNTTWGPIEFFSGDYELSLSLDLSAQTNTSNLRGYTGGNLCTTADDCSNASGGYFVSNYVLNQQGQGQQPAGDPSLTSGSLSSAPEPSSFLLIAASLFWFGIRRQRRGASVRRTI